MKATRDMYYFWGEKYSAVSLSLNIGGQMWFILPDEGVDVDEIFSDPQMLDLVTRKDVYGDSYENGKFLEVNLSVPKFDVKSEKDVLSGIKKLGVTDVTDELRSDFSPLATNPRGIFIDKIDHGVRVKIDEEGVQAAVYTVIRGAGSAMPPDEKVDFVLDRPFAFVISLDDNVPLFSGVVNNP
jgi:serine protease inhibitor